MQLPSFFGEFVKPSICLFFCAALLTCVACSNNDGSDMSDASQDARDSAPDRSDATDALADDAGDKDQSADSKDEAPDEPAGPIGAIYGACGVIDDELTEGPSVILNNLDFESQPFTMADAMRLTSGGQIVLNTENAGGSSVLSEVFSFEILARCEMATLLKTETEILYNVQGKITDLLVDIDGQKVGVSVTRAVKFPRDAQTLYTKDDAATLLSKKLNDVLESSQNVGEEDRWVKQILHVLAYDLQHVEMLQAAYDELDAITKADTIVWITVTDGDDLFLY